jgi:hypothetical protein
MGDSSAKVIYRNSSTEVIYVCGSSKVSMGTVLQKFQGTVLFESV